MAKSEKLNNNTHNIGINSDNTLDSSNFISNSSTRNSNVDNVWKWATTWGIKIN